jgi:hypothetical protein
MSANIKEAVISKRLLMRPSFLLRTEENHLRHFRKKRIEMRIIPKEIKKRTPEV